MTKKVTCDNCKTHVTKYELYETIEQPKHRFLCSKCFWIWVDIKPVRRKQ